MTLPTLNDVQAIEPILTNMLIGYQQADMRFVASRVFPNVSVANDSGTYYIITKKYFFLDEMETRAPGDTFRTADYGVSTNTYKTLQYALDYALPDEVQANSLVPMDLADGALRLFAQRSLIRKEVQFATDFMVTSVWGTDDNNSTTDWDDFQSGDPANDILTARRTISNNTGQDANALVVGYIVHQALANHPDLIDRVKYTQAATVANMESAVGAALGIENYLVAKGTYSNTNEAATFSASAIIDDDALVTYIDPNPGMFSASAGKTFIWPGGGGAGSVYTYYSDERHATILQHKEQWDQVVTATDLGYFFADVV